MVTPAMARIPRKEFDALISAAKKGLKAVHTLKAQTGDNSYSMVEAVMSALADMLDVDEKCRIVLEYDPAEEKIALYRSELAGKVKDFKNYQEYEKGNEIVVDEKELVDALENLPENPYQPMLWADESGEVVIATSGNVLKFKKREDAHRVFANIEELFDAVEYGKANGATPVRREIF